MAGKVRMRAASVPRFRHAGLVFGPGWNDYALAELGDEQRLAIRTYLGRFIAVHPSDTGALRAWLANEGEAVDIDADEADIDIDADTVSDAGADTENDTDVDTGTDADDADLESMTMRDLRAMADDLGIQVPSSVRKKAELIELLADEDD